MVKPTSAIAVWEKGRKKEREGVEEGERKGGNSVSKRVHIRVANTLCVRSAHCGKVGQAARLCAAINPYYRSVKKRICVCVLLLGANA